MSYAEPASQRELTDGRERQRTSRRPVSVTPSHDAYVRQLVTSAPVSSAGTIEATRALLDSDETAARLVAATVSTMQSTSESRPAFVKRIVRAWLEEMANQ